MRHYNIRRIACIVRNLARNRSFKIGLAYALADYVDFTAVFGIELSDKLIERIFVNASDYGSKTYAYVVEHNVSVSVFIELALG